MTRGKFTRRISRSESDGENAPGYAGKNHFVREQRAPLAGLGMVVRRAADEFVPATPCGGPPDEAGEAEGGDDLAAYGGEKAGSGNLKPD